MVAAHTKSLTIRINFMGTSPNGTPLLLGAPNQPAVLSGSVLVGIVECILQPDVVVCFRGSKDTSILLTF